MKFRTHVSRNTRRGRFVLRFIAQFVVQRFVERRRPATLPESRIVTRRPLELKVRTGLRFWHDNPGTKYKAPLSLPEGAGSTTARGFMRGAILNEGLVANECSEADVVSGWCWTRRPR